MQYNCSVDLLKDPAYRNASYRKSKEDEEQEDRVIYLLENGTLKPAETLSEVIRAISEIKMKSHRLYYDSDNSNMVDRLREDGWSIREEHS